jgi:putative ABC transport system substrate-binding protein
MWICGRRSSWAAKPASLTRRCSGSQWKDAWLAIECPPWPTIIATATHEGAGALFILPALPFTLHHSRLAAFAATHRLPAIYWHQSFVTAGGLLTYGPKTSDLYRRAAHYVGRILKGVKPADLPVERPITFELTIKLKTAQALSLTIPPSLLFQATEVIR